jgi:hypothetical protein
LTPKRRRRAISAYDGGGRNLYSVGHNQAALDDALKIVAWGADNKDRAAAHGEVRNKTTQNGLSMTCILCEDTGWVCENHPDTPWDGEYACTCGGAGMPCPQCNPSDLDHPPRPPAGTHIEFDEKGWRH